MWRKLRRLTRGSGRRKLCIAIWLAIFVLAILKIHMDQIEYTRETEAISFDFTNAFNSVDQNHLQSMENQMNVFKQQSSLMHNVMVSNLRKRLIQYCNPPGPVLGKESHVPMEYAQFKLKQVQIVVRHGDRSSNGEKLQANPYNFNCDIRAKNSDDFQRLQLLWEMEKIFKKTEHRKDGKQITKDFLLCGNVVCRPGQLTSKGYLQHMYLGEHIFNAYGKKLGISIASAEEEEMLVYATPVERTQQSAAVFLTGMLQTVYKNAESTLIDYEKFPAVKIQVSPDKLGVFQEDENGDIHPCARSPMHQVIKQNKKSWDYRKGLMAIEPLMETFSYLFNVPRSKLPSVTELADIIVTHHCHNHPPVCGPNGCVDDKIKAESLQAHDWVYTLKYTNQTSIILTYPLLSKIFQRMISHISGKQQTKFVLFATHDSTIVPTLVNLGIFQNQWPPYTSRIVFELWEAGGLLGKVSDDLLEKHFVRVLFNGIDYTTKITMCKDSLKFGKLCSLKSFITALETGAESMREKYANLCQI